MRIRSTGLTLFMGLSILVAACSNAATSAAPSAPASAAPTSAAATTAASTAPSAPASVTPTSDLKIGVVTDVGTVNDKNFNEYTYNGAVDGAPRHRRQDTVRRRPDRPVGLRDAQSRRTSTRASTSSWRPASTSRTPRPSSPRRNKDIWFIGVDHNPCINATGDVDPTFSDCSGDVATLIPNYIALNYAEDQAGYLAGIVAASASKSGIIGAVGGVAICGPCVRYIQGYNLGAKSVNPAIKVKTAWVTASDFAKGFFDQPGGTAYGANFIKLNPGIDVVFQVAGN